MSDQKIENLLNLAAGSTNSEKEKSENLGVGFDPQTDTWEIIVKYTGDILALESRYPGIRIVRHCNNQAKPVGGFFKRGNNYLH